MYRINQQTTTVQSAHQPIIGVINQLGTNANSGVGKIITVDEDLHRNSGLQLNHHSALLASVVKTEPMHDVVMTPNGNMGGSGTSSSGNMMNGHIVNTFGGNLGNPSGMSRIDGEDWLSSSPGSVPSNAPPMSPSPSSQNHIYNTNLSNGYASPMSTGSYDPYSPNGKLEIKKLEKSENKMMKRRWSNNGGFALRLLEESSSEVTSSSAGLVMPQNMAMSPTSLGSPEYGELELWTYEETPFNGHGGIITNGNNGVASGCNPPQITVLPSLAGNINHTPRSESVNSISSGRDDLSPSSSINGYSVDGTEPKRPKKGPTPRQQEELCLVCGDRASGYHYNALTCEGCKGFFRRSVTKNAVYCCKFGHECEMDMYMRRKCQECRLKKCLAVGMRPECVVPENQCAIKRKEKKAQKERDKQTIVQTAIPVSTSDPLKTEVLPKLMKCEPPPQECTVNQLLPQKLLDENRQRNIPQLTANQMAVIFKLIWYQDGYEQPSEEDLKRIMIGSPNEEEDQHDIHFRHITEITILTVQLIVEFAKGLPAFTKIPQEDQITLLKACSSEVMMLRMARRYDADSDSILFANNRTYTRDSYIMAGMAETIEDLLHFCRQMYRMAVDNVEYALLTAIVIFSDRPGLEQADLVEAIQSYYIDTLKVYILNRHGGDPKSSVLFAKLLSILTELRTLGNQNSEMCFSLKLKNRKLPRFLEEIWDVNDVPPLVAPFQSQSHLHGSATTTSTSALMQEIVVVRNSGSISGNGPGGGGD